MLGTCYNWGFGLIGNNNIHELIVRRILILNIDFYAIVVVVTGICWIFKVRDKTIFKNQLSDKRGRGIILVNEIEKCGIHSSITQQRKSNRLIIILTNKNLNGS